MSQEDSFILLLDENEKRLGLNDNQLAQRAGISHTVLVKARQGSLPKWDACYAIATALDIPPQEVFISAKLMDPPLDYDIEVARLVHKIASLPPDQRQMAEAMIDGLTNARAGKDPALVR